MSSYELYIAQLLTREHYRFQQEKTFKDLKGGKYRYDFYLPDIQGGIIIELQGEQHYQPIYGAAALKKAKAHDAQKISYCLAHNIPIYIIPYWEIKKITTMEELLNDKYIAHNRWKNDDDWREYQNS